ncbi:Maf-like protein [Flavobacterium caeni]|uniref:dTTP/UTP pyrophosphatase n=1 Tax=Flavobacterium caeni TaxID=490189 RepID=A0A1G5BN95_9FLAO|nr:Maf-like protein [Flavobacterium caeni]SCX91537.1 septum formation protein [Flavobacterium caeni]
MLKSNYKIILASGSPRRQQFFKDLDLDFEIRLKDVDEVYPPELQAEQITNYLAVLKADAFRGEIADNELLVTSDTIVWHKGRALGKPKDYEDAVNMLQTMAGSTHEVITSVCLTTTKRQDLLHEVTRVTFADLSEKAIRYYLDKHRPFDKAGAYGIQDWIGLVAISKIEGSYTNVVGLPTHRLFDYLSNLE